MTDEQTVERIERPCPNCGVMLNGYSGLRHCGTYTTHSHADCIRNLTARAEKAEAERDTALRDLLVTLLARALAYQTPSSP